MSASSATNLFEARGVCVSLGGNPVLTGASFALRKGEVLGLIGPNGSGKSTLLRALCGLLKADGGEISLLGKSLARWNPRDMARQVAYMAQGNVCHWPLLAEKVVALGRIPHLAPWQQLSARDAQAIRTAMTDAEVDYLGHRTVDTLSQGERARVLLARALAVETPVLLTDEPVASLDPSHQMQVMELLRRMAGQGRGIIVVLHDLALASRFCDRLALLHDGKILASGEPRDVLTPENLKTAYHITAQYGSQDGEFFVLPWKRMQAGESETILMER